MKFSILFVCGKWVKPHIRNTKHSKGVCLGWFAITMHPRVDLEELISFYVKERRDQPKIYSENECSCGPEECKMIKGKCKNYAYR